MKIHRRELTVSPTENNEDSKLERSRPGKASNAPSCQKNSPPVSTSDFLLL